MALKITKVDVWHATIQDRPGGLSAKLEALAKAGADLEFVIARRSPDKPGQGVVFVTPIKGGKRVAAAQAAGFSASQSLHSVRLEGPDKPGLGFAIADALAQAGLNLRGLSAGAIGRKMITHLAFDSAADAATAVKVLKKVK